MRPTCTSMPQRETLDDYVRNIQIMKTKQAIFKTIAW